MEPMYAHCPQCSFPVVVSGSDVNSIRRCRQCGETYKPDRRVVPDGGAPRLAKPSNIHANRHRPVPRRRATDQKSLNN